MAIALLYACITYASSVIPPIRLPMLVATLPSPAIILVTPPTASLILAGLLPRTPLVAINSAAISAPSTTACAEDLFIPGSQYSFSSFVFSSPTVAEVKLIKFKASLVAAMSASSEPSLSTVEVNILPLAAEPK